MDPSKMPSSKHTPDASFFTDFQDLGRVGMSQALEIQKASFAAVAALNSCVLNSYESSFWFAPIFGNLLEAAAQAFACYTELQMNWLRLLAPQASSHVAASDSTVVSSFCIQIQPADVVERSMDIVIGEHFTTPGSRVVSISGNPAPAEEELQEDEDVAILAA